MRTIVIIGLLIAFVLAIVLSPFASSSPDGLEKVGEDEGFLEKAHSFLTGLIPDYLFPGVSNEKIATAIAGGLGVVIVFGLTYGLALIIKKRSTAQKIKGLKG
jgi:cobalt/nickel transport protein